jgi:CubicO group peptidase (beta-lactamase class C family)
LLDPLGITLGGWRVDPQGIHRGGWDMYFTPRDMARFGQLYLKKGRIDRQRIVPRKWVKRSTRPLVRDGSWGPFQSLGYGFWWWTGRGPDINNTYLAWGYGGQHIFVVPRDGLIVVTASEANVDWDVADAQEIEVLHLVVSELLEPIAASGP